MSQVTAQLNGLRIAPRKVRAVVNLVKGKDVMKAIDQLEYMIRKPSDHLIKLINSAIANAENLDMIRENLYIKEFIVDEGIKLKRMMPKGFGRASMIQKKTSRIRIVLAEKVAGLKQAKQKAAPKHKEEARSEDTQTEKKMYHESKKPEIKKEIGKKPNTLTNLKRRFFQRKAI